MHKLFFGAFCAVGTFVEIIAKKRRKQKYLDSQASTPFTTRSFPLLQGQNQQQQQQQQQQFSNSQFVSENVVIPVNFRASTTYFILFIRIIQLILSYYIINNVKSDHNSSPNSPMQLFGQIILLGILEVFCWQTNNLQKSLFMVSKKLVQNEEDQQQLQEDDADEVDQLKQAQKAQLRANFSGTWIKDVERSDCMEEVMDLMKIGGLLRSAIKLIRGMQIEYTEEHWKASVFSFIPWFKISEKYPTNGETRRFGRRDLRAGKHTGYVEEKPSKVVLQLVWNEPYGGTQTEIFSMPVENELHHETNMQVGGKTVSFTTIYKKQK
eukprot:TRINITY_DN1913_c1_g3_i1.p1 TRINITY_DN1913_c1_g3~~TRINITY_DN1913_c1_g3_i1.p1  ORF type:complete len:323 (-),score=42.35 TRINITY_DN1913_c1_g3_i1:229-1197(-)